MSEAEDSTNATRRAESEEERRSRTLARLYEAAVEHFDQIDERETNREAQRLAIRLVLEIGEYFAFGGDPGKNVTLVLEAMMRVTERQGIQLTRACVVESIRQNAKRFSGPMGARAIDVCIRQLSVWDDGVRVAPKASKEKLGRALHERFTVFDENPRGKADRKGAERITAELIHEGLIGNLDIETRDDDDETEIERIRKRLADDVKDHAKRLGG